MSEGAKRADRGATRVPHRVLLIGGLLALAAAVIVCAWVSDDALITLRTVDHFLHGRGLRFNALERVQAYTHPLWLVFVTPFVALTGEGLWAPIAASLVCTAAAVALVVRLCGTEGPGGWTAVLALVASKSFVDFSTSGLENPLTHLLLAVFVFVLLRPAAGPDTAPAPRAPVSRRRLLALSACSALLFVDRMDAVLLLSPVAGWVALELVRAGRARRAVAPVLLGLLPALLWLAFATLYYGSPWPNTAYAKLSTGIGAGALIGQGLLYLRDFIEVDSAGALVLMAGTLAGLTHGRLEVRALAAGLPLYVLYTVWIGGDFMLGRFFTPPVFLAALLLGIAARAGRPAWQARFAPAITVAAVLLSVLSPVSPLRASPNDTYALVDPAGRLPADGIVDERLWYYTETGALSPARSSGLVPRAACAGRGAVRLAPACGGLGRRGFESCAGDHWIDSCGLTDAFLARRPIPDVEVWRIGHFQRAVPPGYVVSVRAGRPLMRDPALDAAFDRVRLLVRAPLFSSDRLRAIFSDSASGSAAGSAPGGVSVPAPVRAPTSALPPAPAVPPARSDPPRSSS